MSRRRNWKPDDSLVLVVAAGQTARTQAIKYGIYQCQNHRSFRPAGWIAFYSRNVIDVLAKIAGPPEDDVQLMTRADLRELADEMPYVERFQLRTVFRLVDVKEVDPIMNDLVDKNERRTAWTQSQRYVSLASLKTASKTSDLNVVRFTRRDRSRRQRDAL